MKKMTKLLSVILAFVMALSCMTMMASAAKTNYRTVDDLEKLNAYSPYGTVTRLDSEARMSILLDYLDNVLNQANINMGQLFNIAGLSLTIDLRSVNALCGTVDNVKSLLNNGLVRLVKGLLGIIADVNVSTWQSGMTREGTAQLTIIAELLELLSNNTTLIDTIFTSGIKLGVANSALPDMSGINKLVTNIPGAVTPFILSMLSRPDDEDADRKAKSSTDSKTLVSTLQQFVVDAFSEPMSTTSYRVNANGENAGYTPDLPQTPNKTSRYFIIEGNTITQYDYKYNGLMDNNGGVWRLTATYTKDKTEEFEGSGTFLYRDENGESLKWYKADGVKGIDGKPQSQYLIPSIAAAMKSTGADKLTFEINGADSLGSLLYKFIPYIFAEMAPTVLNGSAKKLIAEAFDVEFKEIKGDALAEAISATGNPGNFFTKPQEYYVWEYTDYIVVKDENSYNGYTPYYRYQDRYFKGTVPNNISHYYEMFNWNWEITDDFLNEFIPDKVSTDKYLLDGLNNLIGKAIKEMLKDSWTYKGLEYKLSDFVNWKEGGNEKLLENILNAARGFFSIAPEEILDEYYKDAQFYKPMMEGTLNQAVNALICELVKMIMPQIKFPDAIVDAPITAIAAVVVRELCTQLMPTYNFDAMIYANYGDSSNATRTLVKHSADEWLDITLYMGVNLGMYYLRNLADIGEDDTTYGYYSVMQNLGALPALKGTGMEAGDAATFTANSYKTSDGTASWLVMVDWIADWALSTQTLWCWKFTNFVDVTGKVDLTTYENPFDKISSVFTKLFPELNTLLNTDGLGNAYGSSSVLAKVLKSGFVDAIVELDVTKLLGMLQLKSDSVLVSTKLVDSLINKILKPLLNGIFYKLAGNTDIIPSAINSVDTLLNQNNIKTFVKNLVGALYTAYQKGLLDTVLPLANFFIGWKTDPQEYAEPILITASSSFASPTFGDQAYLSNTDYLYAPNGSVTTTFSVTNNSSGMLLKHRNSTTTDHAYDIDIISIESGTPGVTVTADKTFSTIAPYSGDSCNVTISGVSGTQMVNIIVKYKFTGKNGQPVGGTQSESVYKLVSDVNVADNWTTSETSVTGSTTSKGGTKGSTEAVKIKLWKYRTVFVIGNFSEILKYSATIENTSGKKNEWLYQLTDNSTNAGPFKLDTSVVHGLNENEDLKSNGQGFMYNNSDDGSVSWDFYSYQVADSDYDKTSGQHFNLGYTASFINGDSRDYNPDKDKASVSVSTEILYYNVDELEPLVNNPLYAEQYNTAAAGDKWTEYLSALADAAFLVNGPKRYDTFDTVYSPENVAAKQKALEDAISAMKEFALKTSSGDVQKVITALKAIETNPDRDINFQDYKLFEYFKYENERTAAREMIKSTIAPTAPEAYIDSVWGNELVNAIIASNFVQSKTVYKQGVPATVSHPDDEDRADEWAAYEQAKNDFQPAAYTDVAVENQIAMLNYYYGFMTGNPKGTPDKTFLKNEIDYAEGQNYEAEKYSVDSWNAYLEALQNAKDVRDDKATDAEGKVVKSTESMIFDAKYALMVAQNKLLEKSKSMKDNIELDGSTYLAKELDQLVAIANAIVEQYDTSYYRVNPNAGVSEEEALKALVRALGIRYEDVAVDEDGIVKKYSGILYDYSALTFTDYDRINTVKNKRAVDKAADKLREAIAYFECSAKITSQDDSITVTSDHDNLLVVGFNPNSITEEADLEAKLKFGAPAGGSYVISTSKAGFYGTGTSLVINDSTGTPLVSYFVVIFGDVNGDGAIDAFDAIEVDYAYHNAGYHMGNIYDDAADINHDGIIDDADYAAIEKGVQCLEAIEQGFPNA